MNAVATSLAVFVCVFGGALLGMALRGALPEHHRSAESKDLIRSTMGLIGTMSALVLGLLVASAKGNYDSKRDELTAASANILLLDRILGEFGPEAAPARALLKTTSAAAVDEIWGTSARSKVRFDQVYRSIGDLPPKTDSQRILQSQAFSILFELGRSRWLIFARSGSSISMPLLVIVVFWLTINFVSFGLFASRNTTILVALFVGAVSVAGAVYIILEMDSPFQGLLQIPRGPMQAVIEQLGH
jgi:hypothetical protein